VSLKQRNQLWKMDVPHPLSPVIKLGIHHPRKKEKKKIREGETSGASDRVKANSKNKAAQTPV
jgi:hypothetical protein